LSQGSVYRLLKARRDEGRQSLGHAMA
jgi:hypothetical protein